MAKVKGKLLNRNELADFFGVHITTLDQWIRKGLPYLTRGSKGVAWEFDSAACIRWREEQAVLEVSENANPIVDEHDAKKRKIMAEAELAELELARERRKVIAIDDLDKLLGPAVETIRSRVLALEAKLGRQLDKDARVLLGAEIREMLEELVQYEPEQDYDALHNDARGMGGGAGAG